MSSGPSISGPLFLVATLAALTGLLALGALVANFAFREGELNDKAIDNVMKSVPKLFEAK